MINLYENMGLDRDRIVAPGSAKRYASEARHLTDCATRPRPLHSLIRVFACHLNNL